MTSAALPHKRPSSRVRSLAGPCLLLGGFLTLAALAHVHPYFAPIDLPLALLIQAGTPLPLDWTFILLSALGQSLPWVMLVAGTSALLWWGSCRVEGTLTAAVLLPSGVNALIKVVVDRTRPDPSLVRVLETGKSPHDSSFPSGHVLEFMLLFGLLWVFAGVHLEGRTRRIARGICGLLIALIGLARVYVGAHWPSDALGGYLLGALCLWILVALYRRLRPAGTGAARGTPLV